LTFGSNEHIPGRFSSTWKGVSDDEFLGALINAQHGYYAKCPITGVDHFTIGADTNGCTAGFINYSFREAIGYGSP
jgi:hypothetical protein